jgi:OmpR family response regulator RpaB
MDNIKILIAEDNAFTRKFYDSTISGNVFVKQFAENGLEAVKIYRDWKPDIILLDLMMPTVNGYSVLKQVRENNMDTSTTIIISTSSSQRDDVVTCSKFGVQGYLIKPISPKDLNKTILRLYKEAHPEKAAEIVSLMQYL